MITLTNSFNLFGYTIYRDDMAAPHDAEDLGGWMLPDPEEDGSAPPDWTGASVRPRANRFYVLPTLHGPRLARERKPGDAPGEETGPHLFSLIVYRREVDADDDDLGGGIMTFTVELPLPDEDLRRIRSRVRAMYFSEDDEVEIEVVPVPFSRGRVTVTAAGESGDDGVAGEFVETMVGGGKITPLGGMRQAVQVKLTRDGAALFDKASDLRTMPLMVQYDLAFEHRLVGVTLTAWVRGESSGFLEKTADDHDVTVDETCGSREETHRAVTSITERLVKAQEMGVEVIPASSEISEDTLMALEKFGMDLINRTIEQQVMANLPTPADQQDAWLTKMTSIARNAMNFTMTRHMVLEQEFGPSGALVNDLENPEDHVEFIDLRHEFFERLVVPVRVNADFTRLPIDSVNVTLKYRRRDHTGAYVEDPETFNFTDGTKIQTFATYADSLDQVRYDWSAEVFYKEGGETLKLNRQQVTDRFLVVPVADLGVLDVDVRLGLLDLEAFPKVKVELRYPAEPGNGQVWANEIILHAENQTDRWTEVIADSVGAYGYRVHWLDASDRILRSSDWTSTTTDTLTLDAPTVDKMEVSIIGNGDFDALSVVVCELHYEDGDYQRDEQLSFTATGQVQGWAVALKDADKRTYEYAYNLVHKSGLVERVPPAGRIQTDASLLVVGPNYDIEVLLIPMLLRFGDNLLAVQVDLACADAEAEADKSATFVFSNDAKTSMYWRVNLREDGAAEYQMSLQYFFATREAVTVHMPVQGDTKVLLPPPPPPPPEPVEPVEPTPPGEPTPPVEPTEPS